MQYIEAVSGEEAKFEKTLFLAGGITGCPDWQNEVVQMLGDVEATVWNPRRANFPIGDPNAAHEQIAWEFEKLNEAKIISFWFCKETICPIVLYELGRHLARGRARIVIGVEENYQRVQDVCIQARLVDPEVVMVRSLEDLVVGIHQKLQE